MKKFTDIDRRNFLNHCNHFSPCDLVSKVGRKWRVAYGDYSFPILYKTRAEAEKVASDWRFAVAAPLAA